MPLKNRVSLVTVALLLFSALALRGAVPLAHASFGCYIFPLIGGETSQQTTARLQAAINTVATDAEYGYCLNMDSGTFYIISTIVVPAPVTLEGQGMDPTGMNTTIKADAAFPQTPGGSVMFLNNTTTTASLTYLVIDGNGSENPVQGAAQGVFANNITIDRVDLRHFRCSAVYANNVGMVLENSHLEYNGSTVNDPSCGVPSMAVWVTGEAAQGGVHNGKPSISYNVFSNNPVGALDSDEMDGGAFVNNQVSGGMGMAVSLFQASGWTISGNTINQTDGTIAPYLHPSCFRGPSGAHTAAILLCEDTGDQHTRSNLVQNNPGLVAPYGIISVGNPHYNTWPSGNFFYNNNVYSAGTTINGCGEDQAGANTWPTDPNNNRGLNNNCHGSYTINPGPDYF